MDGVREATSSSAKARLPGLSSDLERTIATLGSSSFFRISQNTTSALFTLRSKNFSGRLRLFRLRNYVIVTLQTEHLRPPRVQQLLKSLSHFGWQATPRSSGRQSLFRILDTSSTTVLGSQVLTLLTELGLPSSALKKVA